MTLLGVDIGTTHCKAGLFDTNGTLLHLAMRPMQARLIRDRYFAYDPEALWQTVVAVIREITAVADPGAIAAIGIASMAETGLLLDRDTGSPRSPMLPWFETNATTQEDKLRNETDAFERFCRTGQHPSFKSCLAKVLWLREANPDITRGAIWLCTADTVAYRLTGMMATDFSLAGRTYAFRLDQKRWDTEWLDRFGLGADLFPQAMPGGQPVGAVLADCAQATGLAAGTPVAIAGHDHVCAAFAVGATKPGPVFDSMGTAEALIGAMEERPLEEKDFRSGLTFSCHLARGRYCWIGGLSTSGGSVEWLRSLLGDPPLSYADLESLLEQTTHRPTGILYFPYLTGSGSPHPDSSIRAAFIGLSSIHRRSDVLKAVLEGTAYEMETIRQAGEEIMGCPVEKFIAAGGGTRLLRWMQIKADVSGCTAEALEQPEATLLGAALVAGLGVGVYPGEAEMRAAVAPQSVRKFSPSVERHVVYRLLYEHGFLALQQPLRRYYRQMEYVEEERS